MFLMIFAAVENQSTMQYKSYKLTPVCLECGDRIKYGRSDKKFCSSTCRNKFYYMHFSRSQRFRRKVMSVLSKNYQILETYLLAGVDSVELVEAVNLGFVPSTVTSHQRIRGKDECCCFDIKYIMTETRISSLTKIQFVSLNLRSKILKPSDDEQ